MRQKFSLPLVALAVLLATHAQATAQFTFSAYATDRFGDAYAPDGPSYGGIDERTVDLIFDAVLGTPEQSDKAWRVLFGPPTTPGPWPWSTTPSLPELTIGPDDKAPRSGVELIDVVMPGQISIDPAVPTDKVGIEGEGTDATPTIFNPVRPSLPHTGYYYGDFIYFPPNDAYPTGVVKVVGGGNIKITIGSGGRIIPMYHVPLPIYHPDYPGDVWEPLPTGGIFGQGSPVNPADHGQPANPFPPHESLP